VPDLTASVSMSRIATIEYPLGQTLVRPSGTDGQMKILEATVAALANIQIPEGCILLSFGWPEDPKNRSECFTRSPTNCQISVKESLVSAKIGHGPQKSSNSRNLLYNLSVG